MNIELRDGEYKKTIIGEPTESVRHRSYSDPLIATYNRCAVFYRNNLKKKYPKLKYSHLDVEYYYNDDEFDTYNYITGDEHIMEEEIQYDITNHIDEVIYVISSEESMSENSFIYPVLRLDTDNILDSIVIMYPLGNIYNRGALCWGNMYNQRMNTIDDWFSSIHNHDLPPTLFYSSIRDELDEIIDFASEEGIDYIRESMYKYINDGLRMLFEKIENLIEENYDNLDSEIVSQAKAFGFSATRLRYVI